MRGLLPSLQAERFCSSWLLHLGACCTVCLLSLPHGPQDRPTPALPLRCMPVSLRIPVMGDLRPLHCLCGDGSSAFAYADPRRCARRRACLLA